MATAKGDARDPQVLPSETERSPNFAARPGKLTPERVQYLRAWLAAGGHNKPSVMRGLARRILQCKQFQTR